MPEPIELNVLQFEVGVNMGDHAETVIRAQQVDPDETVGELARRLLSRSEYHYGSPNVMVPQGDWKLEIRIAVPKEVPADAQ